MTDLLRAVAGLPQSHGGLLVSWFGDQERVGFCLARADGGPEVAVATAANAARFGEVAGPQAEGYARLLSSAPAMLDLLATALLRWFDQGELVTTADIYRTLDGTPRSFLAEEDACAYAATLRPKLAALNQGRPPKHVSISQGVYEIHVLQAASLPLGFPAVRPHYE